MRALNKAARRHTQAGGSGILIPVFSSCLCSNLPPPSSSPPPPPPCVLQATKISAPLPLSFSGNVNVLLTHFSQLLRLPQSSALV